MNQGASVIKWKQKRSKQIASCKSASKSVTSPEWQYALGEGEWSASRPLVALSLGKQSPVPTVQRAGRDPDPV
jgi:hypothetical protein